MTIYIESFLIENILINYLLLRMVYLSTKEKTTTFRLILSSIIGSLFSVLTAMFLKNAMLLNILKVLCSSCMILIAFKHSKTKFIISNLLLFAYTFAFIGAIVLIGTNIQYTNLGLVFASKINFTIITTVLIIMSYFCEILIKHLKFKIKTNGLLYEIILYNNNNKISTTAYLDTGNMLNYNGLPVAIIDINTYLKLSNTNLINFYLSKTEEIDVKTVSGQNKLKLINIDKIEITINSKKITQDKPYIAINSSGLFKNTNYQALITPLFL